MNALPYFLNASLYLLLFYGCYVVLLRRNTFFGLNRAYLLLSVGLSLVLPLIELPGGASNALPNGTITLPTFVVGTTTSAQTNGLTTNLWFWLIYGLGVVVMLVRLGLNGRAVRRLIDRGTSFPQPDYTLVHLPDDSVPSFSFGRYLVLNQTDAGTEPDALIRHEEAHIRQRHTLDILGIELVRAAFWFNPLLLLYKRSLQEVHEFLADEAVAQTAPRPDYARQLVAYALNVPATLLTTPFVSVSTLKQRIVMLQKPQTHRRALLGYALVLPLAGLLTLCTQPDRNVAQTERPAAIHQPARQPGIDGEIFTVVEEQPQFKGGMAKLGEYLSQQLKYPAAAAKARVEGKVFISFITTKSGEIADVKVLKGIGFGADEEAVRVVSQMPRWIPGKQDGKAVNVRYNLPIWFQLEEEINVQPTSTSQKIENAGTYLIPPKTRLNISKEVKHFTINGRSATRDEVAALLSDNTIRVDVNKEQGTLTVTTK